MEGEQVLAAEALLGLKQTQVSSQVSKSAAAHTGNSVIRRAPELDSDSLTIMFPHDSNG